MWGESKVFNVIADVVIIAAMTALLVTDLRVLAEDSQIIDVEATDVATDEDHGLLGEDADEGYE